MCSLRQPVVDHAAHDSWTWPEGKLCTSVPAHGKAQSPDTPRETLHFTAAHRRCAVTSVPAHGKAQSPDTPRETLRITAAHRRCAVTSVPAHGRAQSPERMARNKDGKQNRKPHQDHDKTVTKSKAAPNKNTPLQQNTATPSQPNTNTPSQKHSQPNKNT
eukprot:15451616-Alexandrium_andersonii.AAC.2